MILYASDAVPLNPRPGSFTPFYVKSKREKYPGEIQGMSFCGMSRLAIVF